MVSVSTVQPSLNQELCTYLVKIKMSLYTLHVKNAKQGPILYEKKSMKLYLI